MTDRELLELALDAISGRYESELDKAEEALRERLSQPEPYKQPEDNRLLMKAFRAVHENNPEPEPVAWLDSEGFPWSKEGVECRTTQDTYIPLYTAPPKREWVGLTRAERFEIERAMSKYYDYQHECKTVCLPEFAAAIEAKLKEKNT